MATEHFTDKSNALVSSSLSNTPIQVDPIFVPASIINKNLDNSPPIDNPLLSSESNTVSTRRNINKDINKQNEKIVNNFTHQRRMIKGNLMLETEENSLPEDELARIQSEKANQRMIPSNKSLNRQFVEAKKDITNITQAQNNEFIGDNGNIQLREHLGTTRKFFSINWNNLLMEKIHLSIFH